LSQSTIGGTLLLKDPWPKHQHWVLVSAVCGVLLIAGPGIDVESFSWAGNAVAMLATLFTSAAFLTIRTLNIRSVRQNATIFSFHTFGGMLALASIAFVPQKRSSSLTPGLLGLSIPTLAGAGWLVLMAVCMQVAQNATTELLKRESLATMSIASFFTVLVNALLGCVLGDKAPNLYFVFGTVLILVPPIVRSQYAGALGTPRAASPKLNHGD